MISLHIFTCWSLIVFSWAKLNVPSTETDGNLQQCLLEIQTKYFNDSDHILLLNLGTEYHILQLKPMIRQTGPTLAIVRRLKLDAYVIVFDERFENVMENLSKSDQWNPRAKFVILDPRRPEEVFRILFKHHVINAIALVPKPIDEVEILTYYPFENSLNVVNRTKAHSLGLWQTGANQRNFYPNKLPLNWNKFTLRVIFSPAPPYMIVNGSKKAGIDASVFDILQSAIGFKVKEIESDIDYKGRKMENGSYDGIYSLLQNYQADFAIGLFFANFNQIWDFDMTVPHVQDSIHWAVPKAQQLPDWKAFIKRFYFDSAWILVTAFALITITFHLSTMQPFGKIITSAMICFKCFLGQTHYLKMKRGVTRFIFFIWVYFSCIFTTAFQSHMTSLLKFDFYEKQISTAEELLSSDLKIGIIFKSMAIYRNAYSEGGIYDNANFVDCSMTLECLNRTAFQRDIAVARLGHTLIYNVYKNFLGKDGKPLIYIIKDRVTPILVSTVFSKGCPIYERFNHVLGIMQSNGVLPYREKMSEARFIQHTIRQKRLNIEKNDALSIYELSFAFIVLSVGLLISLAVFILENLIYFYVNRNLCKN